MKPVPAEFAGINSAGPTFPSAIFIYYVKLSEG